MKTELKTGEWQVDPRTGRRFRKIGDFGVEWEPVVYSSVGFLTQSELTAHNERKGAERENGGREPEKPKRHCPLRSGMKTECTGAECALFVDGQCSIGAQFSGVPTHSTADKACPFDRHGGRCRPNCVLRCGDGCKLTTRKDD